jgi:hypothetical protein
MAMGCLQTVSDFTMAMGVTAIPMGADARQVPRATGGESKTASARVEDRRKK